MPSSKPFFMATDDGMAVAEAEWEGACRGLMRAALVEAHHWTQHRTAFQKHLFPYLEVREREFRVPVMTYVSVSRQCCFKE